MISMTTIQASFSIVFITVILDLHSRRMFGRKTQTFRSLVKVELLVMVMFLIYALSTVYMDKQANEPIEKKALSIAGYCVDGHPIIHYELNFNGELRQYMYHKENAKPKKIMTSVILTSGLQPDGTFIEKKVLRDIAKKFAPVPIRRNFKGPIIGKATSAYIREESNGRLSLIAACVL